jgi:hypothetical protein
MAAPPEIRRSALDDALGNGSVHAAPGERKGHAIPTQDGDEFRHHIALGNDGDTPRLHRITGLAWSGHGKVAKVEISTDEGKTWKQAQLSQPVLPKAQTRFQMDWVWDGKPTKFVSRSTDKKGNIQPDRKSFIAKMGTNALFHYNAQQTWSIDGDGRVRNALA